MPARSTASDKSYTSEPDYNDPDVVIDLFHRAARANRRARRRRGATVHLPGRGRLLMTGDLHDHALNYLRLLKLADLDASRFHHLILHEVIHGDDLVDGVDFSSVQMLARMADLKLRYPSQVHLMLGNHELAQLVREDIVKGDVAVVDAFAEGLDELYGHGAAAVRDAMHAFIRSLLLAVKCANGIFCSHSLPEPGQLDGFDAGVIHRAPTEADLSIDGHAYNLVWGRGHTPRLAEHLARAWGVKLFVMGHQPAPDGYIVEGQRMLVLASDHEHGVALPIRLSRQYDMATLVESIVPLASVQV